MIRSLALAALLCLCACAKEPPAPPPSPPASSPEPAPAAPAANAAPSAKQTETEQAKASQESADGGGEHAERSDASLEKIAALPPAAQLPGGKWQAGVNYQPLVPAQPTNVAPGKVEVLEIFWLACPHCYGLEPYLRAWKKTKPSYIEFTRVPVMWDDPMRRAHARLFYTLEALGRDDLVDKAMEVMHTQQMPLAGQSDDESLRLQQNFATQNGVSADDFAKAYNSFSVNANLQRAEELTQRYRVSGVPFMAVNGKYWTDLTKAGDGKAEGSEDKLIAVINDLAASEHRH
ncbi:MAG TPA: thiol:disulfide interchange protein DsbA/DsbL [Steroidobacteraceae bacterium]|nr:thiol:disulfide interchange protein DsbA/DsbL [Steroidobacteraceae bacterium]